MYPTHTQFLHVQLSILVQVQQQYSTLYTKHSWNFEETNCYTVSLDHVNAASHFQVLGRASQTRGAR